MNSQQRMGKQRHRYKKIKCLENCYKEKLKKKPRSLIHSFNNSKVKMFLFIFFFVTLLKKVSVENRVELCSLRILWISRLTSLCDYTSEI